METKVCISCNLAKLEKQFCSRINKDGNKYVSERCRFCIRNKIKPDLTTLGETRICPACKEAKLLKSFRTETSRCNTCYGNKYYGDMKPPFNRPFEQSGKWFKYCLRCDQTKPLEDFRKIKNRVECCKECRNKQERERYRTTPSNKRRKTKSKYDRERYKKLYSNPDLRAKRLESQRKRYKPLSEQERKFFMQKYADVLAKGQMAYRARKMNAGVVIPFTKSEIIKRDGLNCYLCDKELTPKTATIDHIMPLSRGGFHCPSNAAIACRRCNSSKNNLTLEEYLERIRQAF